MKKSCSCVPAVPSRMLTSWWARNQPTWLENRIHLRKASLVRRGRLQVGVDAPTTRWHAAAAVFLQTRKRREERRGERKRQQCLNKVVELRIRSVRPERVWLQRYLRRIPCPPFTCRRDSKGYQPLFHRKHTRHILHMGATTRPHHEVFDDGALHPRVRRKAPAHGQHFPPEDLVVPKARVHLGTRRPRWNCLGGTKHIF